MKKQSPEWIRALATASSAGFTLFGCIMVGVFIGHSVDSFFYVSPWGLIFFSFLGAFTGFWSLFRQMIKK